MLSKFLPSIGVGYNLQGQPRPTISFSLNRFYDALQQKEIRKMTRAGIIQEVELLQQQNQRQVKEQYQNYLDQKQLLAFEQEQAQIDSILFSFVELAYQAEGSEMLPSEYFRAKKSYLSVQQGLLIGEMRLRELERAILTAAHCLE